MSTTLDDKIAFLEKASSGKQFTVGREDAEYTLALEAYQRGWIGRTPTSAPYANGGIAYIAVFELTSEGYAALDALRKEREDTRPVAKVKRAGLWFGLQIRDLVTLALGGLITEAIRMLLERLF